MSEIKKSVAGYYDKNTKRFLSLGQGGKQFAIHRAVWGPDVKDRHEAMHYVHGLILDELAKGYTRGKSFVDLGCGVGGTLLYLAQFASLHFKGVSISPVQIDMGSWLLTSVQEKSITLFQGDYLEEKTYEELSHFEYCLTYESFVHAENPGLLVTRVMDHIKPGGIWFVCDDFLNSEKKDFLHDEKNRDRVNQFKKGWHAPQLMDTQRFEAMVQQEGFVILQNIDLTGYLELNRPRDRFISLFVSLAGNLLSKFPSYQSMLGGNALQKLLSLNLLNYRYYVLQKPREP